MNLEDRIGQLKFLVRDRRERVLRPAGGATSAEVAASVIADGTVAFGQLAAC
jgi:hypothetical protein